VQSPGTSLTGNSATVLFGVISPDPGCHLPVAAHAAQAGVQLAAHVVFDDSTASKPRRGTRSPYLASVFNRLGAEFPV